jgi:hypothetical protein
MNASKSIVVLRDNGSHRTGRNGLRLYAQLGLRRPAEPAVGSTSTVASLAASL